MGFGLHWEQGAKPVPARLTYQEQKRMEAATALGARGYFLAGDTQHQGTCRSVGSGQIAVKPHSSWLGLLGLRERDVGFLCPHHSHYPMCPKPTSWGCNSSSSPQHCYWQRCSFLTWALLHTFQSLNPGTVSLSRVIIDPTRHITAAFTSLKRLWAESVF